MLGKLARQFAWISLAAITCVGLTLVFFEYRQNLMFRAVQAEQIDVVERIQSEFMRRAQEAARHDLLRVQESANADASRLVANSLWHGEIAPLIGETNRFPSGICPAKPGDRRCIAESRARLRDLPGLARLDRKVRSLIRHTAVLKVKVYDLHGMTVYSSDPEQVGEDQSANPGIQNALAGRVISELEYKASFNTFEGIANKVDVIGSYLPLRIGDEDKIVGVVETYTDVTPFVRQIDAMSTAYAQAAHANSTEIEARGAANADRVLRHGVLQAVIVAALLASLFALLVAIVRRAQRVVDRQTRERDAAKRQLAQAEKMRSLGQMVAGVAHQLNTPLAFSRSNVEMVRSALTKAHPVPLPLISAGEMLKDVLTGMDQMDELVSKLRDFTRLDRQQTDAVDICEALGSVVYIARAVVSSKIGIIESYADVPRISCNVSQLNHAFLNILMNAAQAMQGKGLITITATPAPEAIQICIRDTGPGIAGDVLPHIFEPDFTTKPPGEGVGLGLSIAADAVADHGGSITVETAIGEGSAFYIKLPLQPETVKEVGE